MNLRPVLFKLGLNKKEVDVYLILLEHGPETISTVARLANHKRSTLYNVMEGLLRKGLVVLVRRNGRTLYDAEKPKKLLVALRARERELEELLPILEKIRNTKEPLPQVEVYDGEEAIRNVYDTIYASFERKKEVCFLTSIGDLQRYAPFALESYLTKMQEKDYRIRELILDGGAGRRYVRKVKEKKIRHPVRLLPAEFPIHNDIAIYGDTVAIFSFKTRSFVTVIDSPEVTKTMRSLYEWAWANSKIMNPSVEI